MPFEDQDIDQMLAPYRTAAQKLAQPFPMLGGQGGHFALQHPLLAGALNQGLLSMAMTPGPSGPEGVGGGISRALQGVLGANQYQQHQKMMAEMLPYQMMQPRLQAEDTLAQIKERGAHAKYFGDETDIREEQLNINQQKADIAQQRADQAKYGHAMGTPEERMAHALHPFKDPQNPTIEEQRAVADEWTNLKQEGRPESAARLNENFTGPGIRRRLAAGDPTARADYQRLIEESSALAGGKAGAVQEADEPTRIMHEIHADEFKHLYDEPKAKIPYDELTETLGRMSPNAPQVLEYKKRQAAANEYRQQLRNDFSNYLRTDAPNFDEYKANRAAYPRKGDSRGMPSGDTRPSTPGAAPAWEPKK